MVALFVEEARLTIMSPLHNVQRDSIEMDTATAWHATSLAEIEPGPFWPKTVGIRILAFRSCPDLNKGTSGSAISPTAYRFLCVRLPRVLFAGYPTPQRDQQAIRASG